MAKKRVKDERRHYSLHSWLIHGKFWTSKWNYTNHVIPPISSSSTFRLESDERGACGFNSFGQLQAKKSSEIFIYERLDEPTRGMLEERLALIEGGESAICFSSGMAAIAAAIGVCVKAGDQILAHRTLYGCTYSLFVNWLQKFGVHSTYCDFKNASEIKKHLNPKTAVVYFETPTNPTLEIIDIESVVRTVRSYEKKAGHKIWIIVDNTFATPFCQRPIPMGVDLVVHSLTKNLCGFGTDMGGAVIGPRELEPSLLLFRKDFGAPLNPKSSWTILVYGLPTLDLRLKKQMSTAFEVARFLESHPKVRMTCYPGLEESPGYAIAQKQMRDFEGNFAPGNMIYFTLKNPAKSSYFVNYIAKNSYTLTLAVSLGQIRTLVEKPTTMTHSFLPESVKKSASIDGGGIRLSIGIEDPRDIIHDLSDALKKI